MQNRTAVSYNYSAAVRSFADHIQEITGEDRRTVLLTAVATANSELLKLCAKESKKGGTARNNQNIKGA